MKSLLRSIVPTTLFAANLLLLAKFKGSYDVQALEMCILNVDVENVPFCRCHKCMDENSDAIVGTFLFFEEDPEDFRRFDR